MCVDFLFSKKQKKTTAHYFQKSFVTFALIFLCDSFFYLFSRPMQLLFLKFALLSYR